jgi:hypothetical protein
MQIAPKGRILRRIFCCHPAKLKPVQVVLTLAQKHFPVASQRKRPKLDR